MGEEWRPAHDWPGYEVSNLGEVRKVYPDGRTRILRQKICDTNLGYVATVHMRSEDGVQKSVKVLRLMVDSFLGGLKAGEIGYNLDGNVGDCSLRNIAVEQIRELKGRMVRGIKKNSRPIVKVDMYGNPLKVYMNIQQAAADCFVSVSAVRRRLCGDMKLPYKTLDFTFAYLEDVHL